MTNQRWRDGNDRYRPTGEVIDPTRYEVAVIPDDTTAKAFIERHHYSRSYPAARFRVGLYLTKAGLFTELPARDRLVGVAVFSHPPSERVLDRLPCERLAGVELGRFVLLDSVPGNGESWFLGQCFRLLRAAGFEALISHSDPVQRRAIDGRVVMPGHVGQIYQATNAVYAGRTKPNLHVLLPDGTVFSPRSMSKIRKREQGYRGCIAELVSHGATPPAPADDLRDWMWGAIAVVARRMRHDGNHRYVWAIDKRLRRDVAALANGSYPKAVAA